MHPVLFKIGPFTFYTYGAAVFGGFLAGLYILKRLGSFDGIEPRRLETGAVLGFVVGFLGAKTLYILTVLDQIVAQPELLLQAVRSGLVFYGAPIAVVPFAVWYLKRHQLPLWRTLDMIAIALCFGHAIGRVGCFFAGCCHGRPTEGFFGVRFYAGLVPKHLRGIALHPVQLYESLGLFIIFALLLWLFYRRCHEGLIFFGYLLLYGLLRFALEYLRGDDLRGFVAFGMSTSQAISLLFILAALSGFAWSLRRKEE